MAWTSSVVDGPPLLERRRLIGRLDADTRGPVTVVTAPVGFGKTELLRQWSAERRGASVIQLIPERGEDVRRFGLRLARSLQRTRAVDTTVPTWIARAALSPTPPSY